MQVKLRQPDSEQDYAAYFQLRWDELRAPWQQPVGSERDELEDQAYHLLAEDESGQVVAVARLHWNTESQAQIRYMAVREAARNRGIGKQLLLALEAEARRRNTQEIILQARETVTDFYARNGYELVEPSHLLFGDIQHHLMRKFL